MSANRKPTTGQDAEAELLRLEQELTRARRMLDDLQRLTGLGSWERDLETDEVTWSDELFRIHGYEPGVLPASSFRLGEATLPEDRERQRAWTARVVAANGEEVAETLRLVRRDGEIRTLSVQAALVTHPENGRPRMIGTAQDITDVARAREAEALLLQVVQSSLDAMVTIDKNRVITTWNPAAERLFGYTADEVIGSRMAKLRPDDADSQEDKLIEARHQRLMSGQSDFEHYETKRRTKDGTLLDLEVRWSRLEDAQHNVIGAVVAYRDITQIKRDKERVAQLTTHDPLTGLLNRHGFEEALERAIARGQSGAVVMLDLDNFKYVNETHGHKLGDAVVAEIGATLSRYLHDGDVLARFGGDEFCVMTAPATIDQARALAEALRAAVSGHLVEVDGSAIRSTASIGVAGFSGTATRAAELLADVDRAMYASKESGRDRVTVHTDADRARARQRAHTAAEHRIHDALVNDRFALYVQPIVNLTSGLMTHCEVLLRMLGEDGELISPMEFLPMAERLGLIHLIDHWVIDHALAEAAKHRDLTFEINLSGATIDDERLEGYIAKQLRRHRADPSRVIFELTETAAVSNITRARDLAAGLSELGCQFAIDDFGAGFSTFYYLKHFPAKYVKIDGEFMNDPHSRIDELVIESIVRIGRELGKLTIAEYVSDLAAMERVRALGVDYGQGYFFAKPFPVAQLASAPRRLLAAQNVATVQPLYVRSAQTFT